MYTKHINKLASNKDIQKVVSRLTNRGIDPLDDFGPTETIVKLNTALDDRTDALNYALSHESSSDGHSYRECCDELQNQIDNMKQWKKHDVKWVYIDDDLSVLTPGKPCLVYENNLKDVNRWITKYLNGQLTI